MDERELKPCPCCGSKCVGFVSQAEGIYHRVFCSRCQIRTSEHPTKKIAKRVWNARAQLEPAVPEITHNMVVAAQNAMINKGFDVEDAVVCADDIVRAALDAMLPAAPQREGGE